MISSPFRAAFAAIIAMGTVAAAGCTNEALPGPGPRQPDFIVEATFPGANLTPRYSWDAGNVASLRVSRSDAFSEISWLIITENSAGNPVNNIASPVVHGVTPTGAQVNASNELELEAGILYQVTAAKADGSAGFTDFICCN